MVTFGQTNVFKDLTYEYKGPYGTCVMIKNGKTYYQLIGETYSRYAISDGWFSMEYGKECLSPLNDKIPLIGGKLRFIKYKKGKVYNGKIRDTYKERLYGKTNKYIIEAYCKKGLLDGKLITYLNGNKYREGLMKNGSEIGLWKYYHKNTLLTSQYFEDNNHYPTNITKYFGDTCEIEYSTDYLNGHPHKEIRFYQSGDTLSTLILIDSAKMIYNYVKFHPSGRIMENGKKQLENPINKQRNIGTAFRFRKFGTWQYFDENNESLRKETN